MKSDYVLQLDEKSICKYCGKYIELLCTQWVSLRKAWFYICFDCRKVFQVGKGEVERE